MLYIKAAGKAVQIGLHCSPPPSDSSSSSSSDSTAAWGAIRPRDPHHWRRQSGVLLFGSLGIPGLLGVIDAIQPHHPGCGRAETAGTKLWPCDLGRHEVLVLDTGQCVKGLVKQLVGPRCDRHADPSSERREQLPRRT